MCFVGHWCYCANWPTNCDVNPHSVSYYCSWPHLMFLHSMIYLEPMLRFYHGTKRPPSYCTFAEWTWCRRSLVDYPKTHVLSDSHQPARFMRKKQQIGFNTDGISKCEWVSRIEPTNAQCTMRQRHIPSFFLIRCLSICPSIRIVQTINAHQGHDVFPSTPNRSKYRMSRKPIVDCEFRIRNISEREKEKKNCPTHTQGQQKRGMRTETCYTSFFHKFINFHLIFSPYRVFIGGP